MVASSGIISLARLAGAPIVPIVCATSRRKVLKSWDRFNLALPFGRGVFLWSEPIEIASDLDAAGLEEARLLVEARMNDMAREADRCVGRATSVQNAGQSGSAPSDEPAERGPRPPFRSAPDRSSLAANRGLQTEERQRS